jgi:spore coat polysaccharide biosynthesis predicted glycosyltransferase SpsG
VHVFFGSGGASARWLAPCCEWLLDAFAEIRVSAVGRADRPVMQTLMQRHAARLDWQEQVDDMAAHMAACHVAIGAPGSATWERACIGLASALVATAANQVPILRGLEGARFCRFLGSAWELDAARFTAGVAAFLGDLDTLVDMRARGVAAVDGRGVERIVTRLGRLGRSDD